MAFWLKAEGEDVAMAELESLKAYVSARGSWSSAS